MRILFFYRPSNMTFNVATPEQQPLGGMASCVCYLARALAARGHNVALVSTLPDGTPPVMMGVQHLPLNSVLHDAAGFFRNGDYDAVIAVNYPDIAPYVKNGNPRTLSVVWLHIYPDQPALAQLGTNERWLDAAVCVSATLRDAFRLSIPTVAIGNAISPFFEGMFSSPEDLLAAKQNRAVYASMPFRGLDLLEEVMNRVKGRVELDVYSSMQTYQVQEKDFTAFYQSSQRNPRIRYHGGIGQRALADALRGAAFLAYPSTFIESYCIVAQEAMAAGLKVISNDLGALPETTMGFADLLPVRGGAISRADHVAGFTGLLEKNEAEFQRDPRAWAEVRFTQLQAVNQQSTWSHRAAQWDAFLAPSVAARRARAGGEPKEQAMASVAAPAGLQQAVLLYRMGNLAEAERSCSEVLRLEPANAAAQHFFGQLLSQRGKHAEALASFDRAIALKLDYTEAYNNRGIALCNLHRFEEAVESFNKALAYKPRAADILNNRGLALGYLKRFQAAVESHDAALAIQPQYFDALVARGVMLQELGHFAKALSSYDEAFALRPSPQLLYNRAIVLTQMSRFADALASVDRALAHQPNYAEAWNQRGIALQAMGRFDEAIASFDRATALKSALGAAYQNRG
jgi:tetratricopeptide (TPR) repeat protein